MSAAMFATHEAARALRATAIGPDRAVSAVGTDSRRVEAGSLFVALRGERFDGHDFVAGALAAGAAAAMVDASADPARWPDASLVVVEDSKRGLGELAKWWRARFTLPAIGVVGSNGKTTTKEMTAAALTAHFGAADVLATVGNLNNDIGLPLTVLRLREHHRAAVFEIGMNHPGETIELAAIAQPTIALVTNAQREHQEFMKSVAEVASEHGALIAALPAAGVAVINADDSFAGYWRGVAGPRKVRDFGLDHPAAVSGRAMLHASTSEVAIRMPEGETSATLALPGVHNVRNALAAAAAASAAGASVAAIGRGLAAFRPAKGRLEVKRLASGATLIDDTYNANPDSVRAAIDVLAGASAPRLLILGDMGEVGTDGPAFHREVGAYARERGVDRLFALGEATRDTVAAFGGRAAHFADPASLAAAVTGELRGATTILVKGSRFMRMERVVEALLAPTEKG